MRKQKKWLLALLLSLSLLLLCGCALLDEDWLEEETESGGNSNSPGMSSVSISEIDTEAKNKMLETGAIREPQVKLKGDGTDTATILLYMNGSDLESQYGEASTDLQEMIDAGGSDNVNFLVQTMGTKKWEKTHGISAKHSQRYVLGDNGLELVNDELKQLDCTKADTLTDFIKWGVSAYPADRYILLFWDHGGGPVYGFGYDDSKGDSDASMSMAEMRNGLANAGVYFDFIGMDCCIMSSLEVGCALYDYCDYTILSEDFESGLGWSYTKWLKKLYENSSIATPDLGKVICDAMVNANEKDSNQGDKSIMAVVDESMMKVLYKAWTEFAYANEAELLGTNYSKAVRRKAGGRILPCMNRDVIQRDLFSDWGYEDGSDSGTPNMADYYVTDIMAVAQNIDSKESKALSSALAQTLCYVSSSSGETGLTGLSVTLPYGSEEFYEKTKDVFTNIGLDKDYITWLGKFTSVSGDTDSYDYDDWYDDWNWDDYDDDYDWSDWDYYDDDSYWQEDDSGWDDWNYDDSYNQWQDDSNYDEWYEDDYDNYDGDYYYDDYGYDEW